MKCSGYQQGRGSQWYPENVKNLMTHFWRNSSVWIDRGKSENGKRDWKWIRHNWSSMKGSFKKQRRASHEANCKVFVNIFPARCKNIWRILNTIASIWSENTFGHYVLHQAQSFPQGRIPKGRQIRKFKHAQISILAKCRLMTQYLGNRKKIFRLRLIAFPSVDFLRKLAQS